MSVQPTEDQIREALYALPQAPFFKPANVDRFVAFYKNDPRVMWHVNRLSGFGGSEVGILVAHQRDEDDAFGETLWGLVAQKLLIIEPKRATLSMRKGILLESGIRSIFLEDHGAVRDIDSIELFDSKDLVRPREWMRYSPDDVCFIEGNGKTERYLIDYKHPSVASLHDEIYLRYKSQLHLGAQLLLSNSKPIAGMLLVQYPESGAEESLLVTEIEFDETIWTDMVSCGDEAWGLVMSGQLPEYRAKTFVSLPPELDAEVASLTSVFVKNKAVANVLSKSCDEIRDQLTGLLNRNRIDAGLIAQPGIKVTVNLGVDFDLLAQAIGDDAPRLPVLSADKMAEYLKETGADMSAFETGETVCDKEGCLKMAEAKQIDLSHFQSESVTLRLDLEKSYKDQAAVFAKEVTEKLIDPPVREKKTKAAKPKNS